jgi:hypothetical protein
VIVLKNGLYDGFGSALYTIMEVSWKTLEEREDIIIVIIYMDIFVCLFVLFHLSRNF